MTAHGLITHIRWILVLAISFPLFTGTARASSIIDPTGDTFGTGAVQLDITSLEAVYDSTSLYLMMSFATPIAPASAVASNSVLGFIDLDADQNASTGVTPFTNTFGPLSDIVLGMDYFVDLGVEFSTPGFVRVYSSANVLQGSVPITYGSDFFAIAIPLALLGGDDGVLNFAAVVGTFAEPTDEVPNGRIPGTSSAVPEPGTLSLLGLAAIALVRRAKSSTR
jgi:hypothetical protein